MYTKIHEKIKLHTNIQEYNLNMKLKKYMIFIYDIQVKNLKNLTNKIKYSQKTNKKI